MPHVSTQNMSKKGKNRQDLKKVRSKTAPFQNTGTYISHTGDVAGMQAVASLGHSNSTAVHLRQFAQRPAAWVVTFT